MSKFNLQAIDPSWHAIIEQALATMEQHYLQKLQENTDWLPGSANIFNAFSLPLASTRYILFGESPYPRRSSANGYSFWDARVGPLWSTNGMSTAVNRATSLRNLLKMLMLAATALPSDDTSQSAIARLDKTTWVQTIDELFANFLAQGFLLLNASLVLSDQTVAKDGACWHPFINSILSQLTSCNPDIKLILFGKIAEKIKSLKPATYFPTLCAEHPYNVSFIQNSAVLRFFKPLNLLQQYQ